MTLKAQQARTDALRATLRAQGPMSNAEAVDALVQAVAEICVSCPEPMGLMAHAASGVLMLVPALLDAQAKAGPCIREQH